jgi:hypothetical protein
MFLISFTASLNDLLFVNRLLVPDPKGPKLLRRGLSASENSYLLRLVASHVWETLLLVEKGGGQPPVREFLENLRPPAPDLYHMLRKQAADTEDPIRETLRTVRNKTLHYPLPQDSALKQAVQERVDEDTFLEHGERMPSIRGLFADEVMTGIWTLGADDREDLLAEIFTRIKDLVIPCIHLAQYALDDFLGRVHRDDVTINREDRRPESL